MPRRVGANFLHRDRSHFARCSAFRVDFAACFRVAFAPPIFCSTLTVGISTACASDMNRRIRKLSCIAFARLYARGRTSSETSRFS